MGKYLVSYNVDKAGWCVYKILNELVMEFHAGPFSEQAIAQSEAKRLNDLEKVAQKVAQRAT